MNEEQCPAELPPERSIQQELVPGGAEGLRFPQLNRTRQGYPEIWCFAQLAAQPLAWLQYL